jgi:hypothetical protein
VKRLGDGLRAIARAKLLELQDLWVPERYTDGLLGEGMTHPYNAIGNAELFGGLFGEQLRRIHDEDFSVFTLLAFFNCKEESGERVHRPIQKPRPHARMLGGEINLDFGLGVQERCAQCSELIQHMPFEIEPLLLCVLAIHRFY